MRTFQPYICLLIITLVALLSCGGDRSEPSALEWVTLTDDHIFSIQMPSHWKTAVGRGATLDDFITKEYLDELWKTRSALLFGALDSETSAYLRIMMDMSGLFVEEPEPIDIVTYVDVQIQDLQRDIGVDNSAVKQSAIVIDGIEGSYTEIQLDGGFRLTVVLLFGQEPRMFCGAVAIAMVAWSGEDDLSIITKIFESFRVLPTAGGVPSCDDRRLLSMLDD